MTQDEIIELARQTGIRETIIQFRKLKLEAFAKLIAAKEREACAKYVESLMIGKTPLKVVMGAIGDAIRARGTRMMQDETIELARQAGVRDDENIFEFSQYKYLKRFAKLVAAKEREACAEICDERYTMHPDLSTASVEAGMCAHYIRARGEA